MKKSTLIFLAICLSTTFNTTAQDVLVQNLIAVNEIPALGYFDIKLNGVSYGGVAMSKTDSFLGKAGSITHYIGGSNDINFWTETGNVIFFPTSGKGGNVGIGTIDPKSKLAVNGQIRATKVKVLADINVPDYVFEPGYDLRTLEETKEYIAENKHLPEIPSASEIGKNGIDLGDMNMRLLKKIEELTLHLIDQNEKMESMQMEIDKLKKRN